LQYLTITEVQFTHSWLINMWFKPNALKEKGKPLESIDSVLKEVVLGWSVEFIQNQKDWPSRKIAWNTGGVERQIEIFLAEDEEHFVLSFTVWKDADGGRYFYSRKVEETMSPPLDISTEKLTDLKREVESISADMMEFIKID
jgi:hypothetical protein